MTSIEEEIEKIGKIVKTKEHFNYQIRPESSQSKVIARLKI